MSLSEAISNVAQEAGYVVDSSILLSSDLTTKQLLAIAQRVNREMALQYAWPQLFKSASFSLVSAQSLYALPLDFSYYHFDTFWNQSTRWRILGPLSEQDYGTINGYGLTATYYQRFQVRGIADNKLLIYPTPASSGDVVVFEYASNRFARPQTWAAATTFAANAYCFYNGNYYTTSAGGSGGSAPTHTTGTVGLWTYYSGGYEKFLADTDEPILPQQVLEQGILERFGSIHGLSIEERFDAQLNEEYSRAIPGQTLYAGSQIYDFIQKAKSGVVVFGTGI